ncbi:MAG: QueT transporter family protein [Deltaproteobacteria bacterium]|nr:QueT transporter family protein [Deltaproteobacteria bacterium]MBI4795790.1 QueT transporter family protein [Deltaproteobacteria bacterium]
MREVWRMWHYSTMVVLTVLTAGIFAAILIPFKGIPLIPGLTELRPANVIPVVFGLLFGPAGAWGAALGNLIGDFFGTLGVGSFFGFWGNFLAAYLPYKMWRNRPLGSIRGHLPRFMLAVLLGAMGCALVVGFGLEALKLLPFSVIAVAVFINNALITLLLGPFLLALLEPRVSRWDLSWTEIVDPEDRAPGPAPRLGLALAWLGAGGGFLLGLAVGLGLVGLPGLPSLAALLTPFVVILLIGCFFL